MKSEFFKEQNEEQNSNNLIFQFRTQVFNEIFVSEEAAKFLQELHCKEEKGSLSEIQPEVVYGNIVH